MEEGGEWMEEGGEWMEEGDEGVVWAVSLVQTDGD